VNLLQTLSFSGRGSAFNVKEGNNCAFFKPKKELMIMIDCGEGIFERILKYNILDGIKVINILITHLHSDHVGSLSSLIYYCYYVAHIEVFIHYPMNLEYFLSSMGNTTVQYYLDKPKENNPFNIIIDPKRIISIIPIRVKHKPELPCFGYIISMDYLYKRIWYSGDTNEISELAMGYNPTEIYQDICYLTYKNNPHLYYKKLKESIPRHLMTWKNVDIFGMHIDNKKLIPLMKKEGFKVVKRYGIKELIKSKLNILSKKG